MQACRKDTHVALRWYAKRAKLYAAFQRFVLQAAELKYQWNTTSGISVGKYFASRIAAYDFWDDTEMWGLISHYGAAIKSFLEGDSPGLVRLDSGAIMRAADGDAERPKGITNQIRGQEVLELWRLLSVLPRNFEDICREWFLPTRLGYACSFA